MPRSKTKLTSTVFAGDLSNLSRLLLTERPSDRAGLARRVIDMAKAGYLHNKTYGVFHQYYGGGAISDVARNFGVKLPQEPTYSDLDYIDCTIHALEALRDLARIEAQFAESRENVEVS